MTARVAITGVGVVSSIGLGFDAFSAAVLHGTDAAGPVTVIDMDRFRNSVACEVRDFEPAPWFRRTDPSKSGRAATFAVAASRMAVADAYGSESVLFGSQGAVMIGTTDGGSHELDHLVAAYSAGDAADPTVIRQLPHDAIARSVVSELGLEDVEFLINGNACAASSQAIGLAADAILAGDVDYAIAGGADAICRRGFAAFSRLNLMAPEKCQPFDVDRRGLLLGEGAAVFVLEDLDKARARGAHIYAELLSYGATCDGSHPVQPLVEGVAACIQTALDRAGIRPDQIDMISAHGTATPTNDVSESRALVEVFGTPPPVTAVKSMIGHSMGAAGAMGALACVAALVAQRIPPTMNHVDRDPACEVDVVSGVARPSRVDIVLNNSLGFFGNNAVVLFGRSAEPS